MNKDDSYFYISGLLSLSIFIFFTILFVYILISSDKPKSFAMQKDKYISVSINTPKIDSSSKMKQIQEDTSIKSEAEEVDIDNLFSEIKTNSTKKTQEEANKRRLMQIKKKLSKSEKKEIESIASKVKNINASKKDNNDTNKMSTANEVNEYLAKIQALVYEHFYPPQNSQGNSVEAVIELSYIGKIYDFRIIRYSSNSELNSECDKIKDRLMSLVFPENPDKKSGIYTITLTSKE